MLHRNNINLSACCVASFRLSQFTLDSTYSISETTQTVDFNVESHLALMFRGYTGALPYANTANDTAQEVKQFKYATINAYA